MTMSEPSSGLYVGLYYTESTMSGLQILVPRKRRTCIPLVKLRDKTELSSEEWKWVCSTASLDSDQLAKNCAVSKDDPMHHLKVEFAHSTATLSRLTQLKWNPSDLYTLDTMQVMMQSASSPQPTIQLDSQQLFSMSPELSKLDLTPSHQGMVAMDQDPVWKMEHIDVATAKAFRVILFVKPTRHATQPQEQFNRQLFELCPFPIFDALHHSVFNTETYHQLRRSMLHLTNEIMDLEFELDQEMEQELAQQKERERAEAESYSDDDEDDMDESSLIEDLGIKGDSPPRVKYHHPRHRSSFIGDEAIHGTGRPSLNSLLEALQQSVAMTSSAVSLASSLSSTGNETPDIVPQDYSAGSNRPRSRTSAMENEMGRGIISPQRRRGSKASQDKSLIDETIRETLSAFMNTARDQGTTKTETIMSANRNNASSLSLESTSSISSASSDESNSNSNRGREVHYEELTRRPFSACTGRMENRSLSQVVSLPRHRRSYSLVQAADVRMAALPGFGSKSSSRPRTNSYSSYTYHSTQHSYYHHYQHQQPVYRNRYLSSKNYPHYLSQIQQHQQHLRHHPHQQQQQQNQHSDDDLLFPDNTDQMNQFPPELARLQKEQQELQEQWRMISWTRQLNEWDHARTLKAQGNLLGYGMGINMGMSMSSGMAVNMSMSINPLDVDDSAEVESSPEL
ncbi:hypothetical protein BC939DRAFT_195118 [Gamsiella multidivaricata]|uniref:uncharacterized protein n=1 Tax=Gamsiella multidivaricata TaxID=101098 RepID=UPI00221ECBD9|nr:uncharacterized protein BC939DRAFT_195118 [Gamsiella multidivaricata]KAI7821978.1 hypothetical protein BC939DRAFT_195118 [Gamsiella multidivaricata]